MGSAREQDERAWEADKRDFVADRRDEIAAERDAAADARDVAADQRDLWADEREADLDERERRLGSVAVEDTSATERAERATSAERRALGRREREELATERGEAASAREDATTRRHAATPATGLARAFAEIARHLYDAGDFDDFLTRVVATTVAAVPGCEMASVTMREGGATFRTLAFTHEAALKADEAQYDAGEGPCLDALHEDMVVTPSLPDPRWPSLASRPAESGVEAVVSYRLAATGRVAEAIAGSLNTYAGRPGAFDEEAQEIGLILAAHASAAMGAVREREAFEQLGRQLQEALSSRDVIGQAKGILMERLRLTPEQAFDALRRSSQQLNVKLREIAERLTETGELGEPRE